MTKLKVHPAEPVYVLCLRWHTGQLVVAQDPHAEVAEHTHPGSLAHAMDDFDWALKHPNVIARVWRASVGEVKS